LIKIQTAFLIIKRNGLIQALTHHVDPQAVIITTAVAMIKDVLMIIAKQDIKYIQTHIM
jgi:hypothetical protein